jgi:hypothetical protein
MNQLFKFDTSDYFDSYIEFEDVTLAIDFSDKFKAGSKIDLVVFELEINASKTSGYLSFYKKCSKEYGPGTIATWRESLAKFTVQLSISNIKEIC